LVAVEDAGRIPAAANEEHPDASFAESVLDQARKRLIGVQQRREGDLACRDGTIGCCEHDDPSVVEPRERTMTTSEPLEPTADSFCSYVERPHAQPG
jgi:hypothetical protein